MILSATAKERRTQKNLRCYEQFKKMDPNQIKIGTMIAARPHSRMLNMTRSLATRLGPLIVDVLIRLKNGKAAQAANN